jgi:hypothetical protein
VVVLRGDDGVQRVAAHCQLGTDGTRLFLDAGTFRFRLLVDHGGTPTDPFDDVLLEFLGFVKEARRTNASCTMSSASLTLPSIR